MGRPLRLALHAAQLAGLCALVRALLALPTHPLAASTALGAAGLLAGATAALFARTWGIGLAFAAAVSFASAAALHIAPSWFWLVAAAGALPQALTVKPFARFDRGATALFIGIATALGASAALAWREVAPLVAGYLAH